MTFSKGPATPAEANVILEATQVFQRTEDKPALEINVGEVAPPREVLVESLVLLGATIHQ